MFEKFRLFILESRQELKKVNWPTRAETIRLTIVVMVLSLGVAFFLGFFDFLFILGLKGFVASAPGWFNR